MHQSTMVSIVLGQQTIVLLNLSNIPSSKINVFCTYLNKANETIRIVQIKLNIISVQRLPTSVCACPVLDI